MNGMGADVSYDCGEAEIGDADYTDGEADLVVLTYPPAVLTRKAYNITSSCRFSSISKSTNQVVV
jgi:hypothetical protein